MKTSIEILLIVIVVTITSAIRVPTTWPQQKTNDHRFGVVPKAPQQYGNQHRFFLPPRETLKPRRNIPTFNLNNNNNYYPYQKPNQYIKLSTPYITRPNNFKSLSNLQFNNDNNNDWVPIIPPLHATSINKNEDNLENPIHKNYRDDNTHEPIDSENNEEAESEDIENDEDKSNEEEDDKPLHLDLEIPTRPNYEGEGKWAKRSKKKPIIYNRPEPPSAPLENESEEVPEGYDIFQNGQQFFNNQKDHFLNFGNFFSKDKYKVYEPNDEPPPPKPPKGLPWIPKKPKGKPKPKPKPKKPKDDDDEEVDVDDVEIPKSRAKVQKEEEHETEKEDESEEEEEEEGEHEKEGYFTPMKLYTQVRRSENEEHLPYDASPPEDQGNLREVIKDSKIQTVYTEEGYEDIGYDHAGHEKSAENDEGFAEFDKEIEKENEKKVPRKRPSQYKNNYRNSAATYQLPNEDLEKYKKEQLSFEDDVKGQTILDSHIAGSENVKNKKPKNKRKKKMKNNNFIKTKETKTTAVKDVGDGNMEMEISSEVKVIVQPNNSTKSHKYVKIYPKVVKSLRTEVEKEIDDIKEEHTFNNKSDAITTTQQGFPDLLIEEIPATTLSTTSLPKTDKSEISILENIEKEFVNVNPRRKRSSDSSEDTEEYIKESDYLPKIEIDTDFIDKINHDIPKPKEDLTHLKYPYYTANSKLIHEDSPLRYSEDMSNIPIKQEGEMTFYEQADEKLKCPEVESTVEPIPERVLNAGKKNEEAEDSEEDEKTGENVELAKSPRLGKLGDKIDCFKLKYFGENPLDSPIFKEEFVGPVKPIFGDIKDSSLSSKQHSSTTTAASSLSELTTTSNQHENEIEDEKIVSKINHEEPNKNKNIFSGPFRNQEIIEYVSTEAPIKKNEDLKDNNENGFNILTDIVGKLKTPNSQLNSNITESGNKDNLETNISTDVSTSSTDPPLLIITTPKYTIDLQPKHIYDQIQLLNYLPYLNESQIDRSDDRKIETSDRQAKMLSEFEETTTETAKSESIITTESSTIGSSKTETATTDSSKNEFLIEVSSTILPELPINDTSTEPLPESQALMFIKRRRLRPRRPPMIRIFDVNKFIPQRAPIFEVSTPPAVLPKYKTISEVYYKDEIKPNEQLTVFADVFNNIKNSTLQEQKDQKQEASEAITVKLNAQNQKHKRIKVPAKKTHIKNTNYFYTYPDDVEEASTTTTTVSPITLRTKRRRNKTSVPPKNSEQFYEEYLQTVKENSNIDQSKASNNNYKTIVTDVPEIQKKTPSDSVDYIEEPVTEVLGLVPPGQWQYKTIYNPKLENKIPTSVYAIMDETTNINKFIVPGMKPPPEKQKVILYSDYKLMGNNLIKRRHTHPRRGKRSANRPSYAELSRNRGKQEEKLEKVGVTTEEDDYVPHRPKNYHYDEKTGKIVYHTTTTENPEDLEYIEVYEEETKAPVEKTTKRPIWTDVTSPAPGKSYIDFLTKVRSDPSYKVIPDPTTTERGADPVTAKSEVVAIATKPVSTTPPAFLNILAKVKSDANYKIIEDPDEKKKKVTTTTEAAEEIVEEDEEEDETPRIVQNAPGGQNFDSGPYQIFDISDFLPKVKNYSPKTVIDTSKYKTIERPRNNLSSRYNEEEDRELDQINTSRKPILDQANQTKEHKEMASESKVEVQEVETTSTTTTLRPTRRSTTTTTTTEAPSTTRRTRVRGRQRSTTVKSVDNPELTTTTTTERIFEQHEKPKRNYIRRRPTRIKIRTTTAKDIEEDVDDSTKILRRRSETETSIIDSQEYTTKLAPIIIEDADDEYEVKENVRQVRISTPEDTKNDTKEDFQSSRDEINPRKIDVEVFKEYDKSKKHGGNYRRENEANESQNKEHHKKAQEDDKKSKNQFNKRLNEDNKKEFLFHSDPKLLKNINHLKEPTATEVHLPPEELEKIVSVIDETKEEFDKDSDDEEVHINFNNDNRKSFREADDDLDEDQEEESQEKQETNISTSKTPVIVKDPSKRLYYYAT